MKKLRLIREQDQSIHADPADGGERERFASMLSKKKSGAREKAFDEFVLGNMTMDEYTIELNARISKKGRGHKRPGRDRLNKTFAPTNAGRRLSEFFGNLAAQEAEEPENQVNGAGPTIPTRPMTKDPQMSLTDILADLDEPEPTPLEPEEEKRSHLERPADDLR